ncbi:hypothetical protein Fcan01_08027 [Folsomia candida]|uniref:Uncharacterized protein n=1 Tax=Folsomia candida TaxID=158441 RepID=A0A226EN64_FOLCA|nr:hypothetical protein Fcan01_08027 [Folsomia candida]
MFTKLDPLFFLQEIAPRKKIKEGEVASTKIGDEAATKTRRCWTSNENESVLQHLVDKVILPDCSSSQVRHQVGNLKKKYQQTLTWRSQTGQGVLAEHGEQYFKDTIKQMCPHFDTLDEIFGEKLSINPPFTLDSSEINNDSGQQVPADNFFDLNDHLTNVQEVGPSQDNPIIRIGTKRKSRSPIPSSGSKALSDLIIMRQEMHKADIEFQREKWDFDKHQKELQLELQKQQFEVEKEVKFKQFELEQEKIRNQFEVEKYRIDQEMKFKLEIAKLRTPVQNN